MLKIQIIILAQVHENYSDSNVPHWKAKGGHHFTVEVDSDMWLYCDAKEQVLSELVSGVSNDRFRYTYLSHDEIFSSSELDEGHLRTLINQVWEEENK